MISAFNPIVSSVARFVQPLMADRPLSPIARIGALNTQRTFQDRLAATFRSSNFTNLTSLLGLTGLSGLKGLARFGLSQPLAMASTNSTGAKTGTKSGASRPQGTKGPDDGMGGKGSVFDDAPGGRSGSTSGGSSIGFPAGSGGSRGYDGVDGGRGGGGFLRSALVFGY